MTRLVRTELPQDLTGIRIDHELGVRRPVVGTVDYTVLLRMLLAMMPGARLGLREGCSS
jgi:hypothetical protein